MNNKNYFNKADVVSEMLSYSLPQALRQFALYFYSIFDDIKTLFRRVDVFLTFEIDTWILIFFSKKNFSF